MNELGRLYLGQPDPPLLVNLEVPVYRPGRVDTFWVVQHSAPRHFQIQAELRLITRHAYWYLQQGSSTSDAALRHSAKEFEDFIYPGVRRLLGTEPFPGIDNDPRVTILNAETPGVAGYVSSADAYSRRVHPYSNEREMVYINVRSVAPGTPTYLSVLAHEFTHLVQENFSPSHDTWIKEGMADLVAALVVPDRAPSYRSFLSRPDVPLVSWAESPGGAEQYESAALFLRYLVDRFGEQALGTLLASDSGGTDGVETLLRDTGATMSFGELFSDWVVANLLGTRSAPQIPGYRSPLEGSVRVTRVGSPGSPARSPGQVTGSVGQYGTNYYDLGQGRAVSLRFEGSRETPRLPIEPRSGSAMWFAGRADGSVATLTRSVDLSAVGEAELRFWAWYDIEKDYDFGYVGVSRDGGASWILLETTGMTRDNETGNNLGIGYTGRSAPAARPEWREARIDLTPYTGEQIMLRFNYITDDAVTREGMALDDIEIIAAAGIFEGAEGPAAEWVAEGWTRIGARVPQTWSVQLIQFVGSTIQVERLAVDEQGTARWAAEPAPDRAVVAVSATTAATLQPAAYALHVTTGPT